MTTDIAKHLARLPGVLDLLRQIAAEREPTEGLKVSIRALLANAPPKLADAPVAAPDAGEAVREAEAALDALLDGERAGAVTLEEVEAGRKALATARAKGVKAAAEHASQVELVERRHAAHLRQLRPLQDELGARGAHVADLREQIRQLQREAVAQQLLDAERALGEAAASVQAVGPRVLPRNRPARQTLILNMLPVAPDTEAFRAYGDGGIIVAIDADPRSPLSPIHPQFNSAQIAAQIAAELEAALHESTSAA